MLQNRGKLCRIGPSFLDVPLGRAAQSQHDTCTRNGMDLSLRLKGMGTSTTKRSFCVQRRGAVSAGTGAMQEEICLSTG